MIGPQKKKTAQRRKRGGVVGLKLGGWPVESKGGINLNSTIEKGSQSSQRSHAVNLGGCVDATRKRQPLRMERNPPTKKSKRKLLLTNMVNHGPKISSETTKGQWGEYARGLARHASQPEMALGGSRDEGGKFRRGGGGGV